MRMTYQNLFDLNRIWPRLFPIKWMNENEHRRATSKPPTGQVEMTDGDGRIWNDLTLKQKMAPWMKKRCDEHGITTNQGWAIFKGEMTLMEAKYVQASKRDKRPVPTEWR